MGRTFTDDAKVTKAALACARMSRETNASIVKFIGHDEDGTAKFAMILVDGPETTQSVVDVLNAAEERWESETETETFPTEHSWLQRTWQSMIPSRN